MTLNDLQAFIDWLDEIDPEVKITGLTLDWSKNKKDITGCDNVCEDYTLI